MSEGQQGESKTILSLEQDGSKACLFHLGTIITPQKHPLKWLAPAHFPRHEMRLTYHIPVAAAMQAARAGIPASGAETATGPYLIAHAAIPEARNTLAPIAQLSHVDGDGVSEHFLEVPQGRDEWLTS
ncbi:hypothetical protein N7499_012253 [Penicillium canescens]|nr:hypothetical protein N7499_012253 [Penicillium canescens]